MTRAEFHNPNDPEGSMVVQSGRRCFLERIEKLIPEVLAGLRADVLPSFRELAEAGGETWCRKSWSVLRHTVTLLRAQPDLAAALAQLGMLTSPVPLADAVQAWATRWNLTDEWIVDEALSTLQWWTDHGPVAHWYAGGIGTMVLQLPDVAPCQPFEPNVESWGAFERRVDEWTRRNRESADRTAADAGFVQAPKKRGDFREHYEWLACWQVRGWTYAKIAEQYGGEAVLDYSTVRKAVKSTADEIRLTLRN